MYFSLFPFTPENLVSRDGFGRPVLRQCTHLHTQAESGAYLRDFSRLPRRRPLIYLNRHTPSGQSRVYWVTQLHTDGVHCRKLAGTGPVAVKEGSSNRCCLLYPHGPINVRLPFPTSIIGMKWACVMQKVSEPVPERFIGQKKTRSIFLFRYGRTLTVLWFQFFVSGLRQSLQSLSLARL